MHNSYGNQRQSQGPYGANLNPDHDPRMGASNMGLPFNPGASASASPLSSLPMFSQQMSYRPEPGRAATEADWDRTMDRTRDDTQHLNTPLSQPSSQMTPQRDDLYCPFTATSSYSAPSSSAHPPARASNSSSGGIDGSLSWLRELTQSTSAKPQTSSFPSSSSSFLGGSGDSSPIFVCGGSQFKHSAGAIPGLGDYSDTQTPPPQRNNPPPQRNNPPPQRNNPLPQRNNPPPQRNNPPPQRNNPPPQRNNPPPQRNNPLPQRNNPPPQQNNPPPQRNNPLPQQNNPPPQRTNPPTTMYGAETATNILRHFNLEKEDLDQLLAIPEEEITPDNLPQILGQIRTEKNRKRAAASASAHKDPSPARPEFDNSSWADSKQTEVMDYGHKDLSSSAMSFSKDIPLSKQSTAIQDYAKDIPPIPTKAEVKIETSSAQPSKVIEYGHTGKRLTGAGTESGTMGAIARAIEGIMKFSSPSTSTAAATTPAKPIPSLGSTSQDQISPATSFPSRFHSATSKSSEKPSTTQGLSSLPIQVINYRQLFSKFESKQAAKKSGQIIIDTAKKPTTKKPHWPAGHQSNPGQLPFASHRKSRFQTTYVQTTAPMLIVNPIQTVSSNVVMRFPNVFPPLLVPMTCTPSVLNQPRPAQVEALTAKRSPTLANVQDYIAACPISFPHTCSLCPGESAFTNACPKECLSMKDWISHQNSSLHIENCKSLRLRYPDWDGKALPVTSFTPSSTSSLSPTSHNVPEQTDQSRSQSPRREIKKERKRSRSASPSSSSRPQRSRSRSHERHESPRRRAEDRRRADKRTSPRRKIESRLVSPPSCSRRPRSRSRSRERRKRTSPKRRDERRASPRSSPQRSRERRYSPTRYSPSRYTSPSRSPSWSSPTPPRGHDRRERRRSLSRSRERRSPSDKRSADKSTARGRKHSELELATKKVLEKSSVLTALSGSADVDSLVETMMPLLMSRLAEEMGPSSAPSTATKKKVVKKTISKPAAVKSLTMVRLGSIIPPLSHDDVAAFAKQFGKTKSILLFRQKCQAVVCFEKEEDAKKLRSSTDLLIKEHPVTIVKYKAAVSTAQKRSAVSGVIRTLKAAAKITPATSETSASEKTSGEASTSKATTSTTAAAETAPEKLATPEPKVEEPVIPEPTTEEPVPSPSPTVGGTLEKILHVKSVKDKVVFYSKISPTCQTSGDSAVEDPSSVDSPSEEILDEGDVKIPETTEEKPESASNPDPIGEIPLSLEPASLDGLLEAEKSEPAKSGHEGADESVSTSPEKEDKPTESSGFIELSDEEEEEPFSGSSAEPSSLTEGETLDKRLTFNTFKHHIVTLKSILAPKFCQTKRELLVLCDLPDYDPQDPYTEAELAEKLSPFGFLNDTNDMYVVPQSNMAFVFMPDSRAIADLVRAFVEEPDSLAVFRGRPLKPHVFFKGCMKETWSFYCWLMRSCRIKRDNVARERTIFISNINSDLAEFRKKLEKFGLITNYVPLLNQVFVEYESNADADRLGVYHSLLNKPPSYTLTRMVFPKAKHDPQPPSVFTAMPDAADRAPGVTVPQMSSGIPPFSRGPFCVTMSTRPFLFPTDSPWFHIPDFETVPMRKDSWERFHAVDKTAIMLTNLQCAGFTHESLTQLVWPWLKGRNLHCFYYDFIILPLQRRAFVNFYSTKKCAQFAARFFNNTHMKTHFLQPHYIDDKLFSVSTEEEVYTTLMALSNSRAPEKHQLEHRLLCVFLGRFSVNLVKLVMEVVASAAPVLGFLPLANRVCIELPKVSDVAKVRQKFCSFHPEDETQEALWKRVLTLETAAEVKRRVKRARNDIVSLESPFNGASATSHYHIYLGREEQHWQRDWDRVSSSSARFRMSSSRESTASSTSRSSRDGYRSRSRSRSSSPRRPSESSKSTKYHSSASSSNSRSSSSRDKHSEKPKDRPKESDPAKSGHKGSGKSSSKTQEKEAESKDSSTCVENIQEVKDDAKKGEELGAEGSNFDQSEEQRGSSETTEDSSDAIEEQISEHYQVLDSVDEAIKSGEDGEESVQVLDSEGQANEEPTDEKLSEEAPNKEMDASRSENVESLKPETGSKRKTEEDAAETQEVCSKTAQTDGQEGGEHETFDIVASSEDQTVTEEAQKGEDVPNDETLLKKSTFKVIDDEVEPKKSETTSTRSTRSGRSTRGDEKEKMEAKTKRESSVSRIEEETVELKAREEPVKDESLTRRRSTRGKREVLDSIEDCLSKQDVSPRLTRGRKSVKTASLSDEKLHKDDSQEKAENKTSKDLKESTTDSEKGVFEILDSVEEGTASITEKSKKGKTSPSDSSEKESTPLQSEQTPAKESQKAKTGSREEIDLVEKVQTRSSRQTRSSQRDQSSDSPLRGNTPTRRGRPPARETKSEKSAKKDLPKVDVQEETEQEIKIQDAAEEKPTASPKARRGRQRKQPQTPAKSEGSKEEGNIQDEKAKTMETVADNVPRTVEEKEDEPSVGETTETLLVKIDKGLQDDALTEDKLSSEEGKATEDPGQVQKKAVELEKDMVESQKEASAFAIVELESSESTKETTIDDQKQSGRLSDRESKEAEATSEVAILEVEKTERRTTRTTRVTRSGKVVRSEGISPKRRRNEPKLESKSESPMKKDGKELSKTESVKDETEGKEQEHSPQVAAKRRGRPRRQPRKSASEDSGKDVEFVEKDGIQVNDSVDCEADTKSESNIPRNSDEEASKTCEMETEQEIDFSVDARDKELSVDSGDVQHSEQERAGKDEAKVEKVDLDMVSDGEKFPDNTKASETIDEEEENLLAQQKTLGTPGEAAAVVEEIPETSKSAKQKLEEGTEEGPGFVMVDGVGEVEEEETPKPPDRGRRSARKTPVGSKRTADAEGPESKRSRSQSPSVPSDTKLPPFRPNNPLGQEYVVPKFGFFCDLCSVFYLNEVTAREQHCSSRRHYDNLKKHLERQSQGAS